MSLLLLLRHHFREPLLPSYLGWFKKAKGQPKKRYPESREEEAKRLGLEPPRETVQKPEAKITELPAPPPKPRPEPEPGKDVLDWNILALSAPLAGIFSPASGQR